MSIKIALLGFGTVASGVPFAERKRRKNRSSGLFRD